MIVTHDNYFSPEASMFYCGTTQYKEFMACPARAMAIIKGEWKTPETTPLLIGSYVDSYYEGTLDRFKAEHPSLFKVNGELKKEFQMAEEIIARTKRDSLFAKYMSGEKQVIMTGEIAGVPVKIKIDSYHRSKAIVDLKCLKDMKPMFNEEKGAYEDFIHYWGYDKQAAFYQAVEGKNLPFYLAVATKEDGIDIELIHIPQSWIDEARAEIESEIGIIAATKRGEIEARRCGRCAYCRSSKKLTRVISANELLKEAEG